MKINDSIQKTTGLVTEKIDSGTAKKTPASTAGGATATESVTLSPLSSQLQSLEARIATQTVYDTDKVDAIKTAITNGQFQVDSGKVADGLIETVKDLLTSAKS
ncbi:flagellar biosynthesis anti-sigma factor FlgM [Methylovorus menthalis]|uniref:flagellar biosynthesis anti-sigma factor FlgM n=1 Tax=Methylovorus menthalis TaxID=1002227 RepID=UPI001E48098A|nr:flagellar biosynthesis anti-sigma factor FlgM [Methylovorus menthalis]MCB4812327.1 flagellar biosynthesis anti-sigma factor FlgM [Methylovorus menthalis]